MTMSITNTKIILQRKVYSLPRSYWAYKTKKKMIEFQIIIILFQTWQFMNLLKFFCMDHLLMLKNVGLIFSTPCKTIQIKASIKVSYLYYNHSIIIFSGKSEFYYDMFTFHKLRNHLLCTRTGNIVNSNFLFKVE